MKSLAVNMQLADNPSSEKLYECWDAVQALRPPKKEATKVRKGKSLPKTVNVQDLPLMEFTPTQKYAAQAVEIIHDFEGDIDLETVNAALEANKYNDLPEPLCPKELEHDLVYNMNVCIVDGENGKKTIIKYLVCRQT